MSSNRLSTPIPKRMRGLQKDRRGYPIPFIVLRDTDGKPHFAINNSQRGIRCLMESRCPICGNRLDRMKWFVGGPQSAFDIDGAYIDPALHYDCMEYALKVCPYLAVPNYSRRIDEGSLDPAKIPSDCKLVFDPTMIPERPVVFVAVESELQIVEMGSTCLIVRPERPYKAVEFWRHGKRITEDEAKALGCLTQG